MNLIEGLERATRKLGALGNCGINCLTYEKVISQIFEIIHYIKILERENLKEQNIKELLQIPVEVIGRSDLFNRMQTWPKGYPGDFEMIEYIMRGINKASSGTIAYYIEEYGLKSPAAQQHRNKVQNQALKILESAISNKDGKMRVLSIACGGCPDIRLIQDLLDPDKIEFFLLDSDRDALHFSYRSLPKLRGSITPVHVSILRCLSELKDYGKFDLVLIGGLFDYLNDGTITKVLRNVKSHSLKRGGKLFYTNIGPFNPDRIWMEYFADWKLTSRTHRDLLSFSLAAGFEEDKISITMENAKITYLVEILN